MADQRDRVVGVSVEHEQSVLPEAQHERKDVSEQAKAPAKLLVVLGEVHNVEQRDLALGRVVAGLSSWDAEAAGCDVDEELTALVKLQPKGITDPTGETILEHKSELLEVKVFANPRLQTLQNELHALLVTGSRYRFLLYSGLTLQNTGCWFLQDGCFGFLSLVEVFHRPDVLLETAKQQNATVDISVVAEAGDWTKAGITKLTSPLRIRLNPPKVERKVDGIESFSNFLSTFLKTPSCDDLLPSTKAIGSFGQSMATMHIFPAGQGDSVLFGVSGFNMLFDGGYARRSCFWEMVRHLPTLDAVVLSHLGPDNLFGIDSFLEKKVQTKDYPELGVVYFNETKHSLAPGDGSQSLLINLADKGLAILDKLRQLGTPVLQCLGSVHGQILPPINVYHKVGHGSVDLYVLSPLNDPKDPKISGGHKSDQSSSCFLLVWQPTSASEKLTRILFPGTTPQAKIFEGLDRLRNSTLFHNALGVAEKLEGPTKGAEKSAAVGVKASTVKSKPPSGARPETKDVKKPVPEQKASIEQHKETVRKAPEQKEAKKPTGEPKDAKKPTSALTEAKNGKAVGLAKKDKESPVKGTPAPSRLTKKVEGDGGKDAKKATAKQPPAATAKATAAGDAAKGGEKLKVETDDASSVPAPSDADEPLTISPEDVDVGELSQVQALPEPTHPEEQFTEEVGMQNEDGDRGTAESAAEGQERPEEESVADDCFTANDKDSTEMKARGDGQNVEPEELFDPSKEWGAPEGLPAPVNGKDLPAAAAKRTAHNVSTVGGATNAKKPDTSKTTETKAGTKRPTTAPERLNNTTREEDTAANQSMAKRPSVTSSHKDGASSVRGDLRKQKPVIPFYVDVAYIPGHGSLHYFDVDFFRRVRARHYILSSVNPHIKALALLVEGKQTWEDPNAEVSIIPTYDSEAMLSWIQENKDLLQKLNIKIGPPAYKCRMQLPEADTSCASYRLEF